MAVSEVIKKQYDKLVTYRKEIAAADTELKAVYGNMHATQHQRDVATLQLKRVLTEFGLDTWEVRDLAKHAIDLATPRQR